MITNLKYCQKKVFRKYIVHSYKMYIENNSLLIEKSLAEVRCLLLGLGNKSIGMILKVWRLSESETQYRISILFGDFWLRFLNIAPLLTSPCTRPI